MTHYKEDEELLEHLREDSGFQAFKTKAVDDVVAGNGNTHSELHETVKEKASVSSASSSSSSSPPSTGRSSVERHVTYTHTEAKSGPLIHTTHPVVLSSASGMLAHEIMEEQSGFMASATHVSGSEHGVAAAHESPELREQRLKDEAKYREKQDEIARKHDKHLEKVTEEYRKKTEAEAEKIRKELEKQYKRDIDYRKEMVDESVKRQKKELELEVKYAKKELDHERLLAKEALEQSKMHTDVLVNLDTSAGHTVSGGSHVTEEEYSEHHTEHKKTIAEKLKETFTGHH
ncbi:hypothetical protein BV898_04607 [Hypsibius exemplaris]|uniref:Uncharacterized protein n=1 Tax=Hypsibius exemplaris TaxID=2072580 RepID=A0A1W0X1Q9_HYPEX|nr:hypothetical protein BV898_04607 [Hypsibius exemplaris]